MPGQQKGIAETLGLGGFNFNNSRRYAPLALGLSPRCRVSSLCQRLPRHPELPSTES